MKTVLIIFSMLLLGFSNPNETNTSKEVILTDAMTFDGYEGEYAFFTNCNEEAIVLLVNSERSKMTKRLIENDVTGTHFQVRYKKIEEENKNSALGIIIDMEPAN